MKELFIASRDSELALIQTEWIKKELEKIYPEIKIFINKIKTKGDKILDTALSRIGEKGLFVKELENELLSGRSDIAVHSAKDLETRLPEELEIICVPPRKDPRDVICFSKKAQNEGINSLESSSRKLTIASSSLRRQSLFSRYYPEHILVDIRGNLNTRFQKLDNEELKIDALILAAAGIKRLEQSRDEFKFRISEYLDPEKFLPAIGQGALAVEARKDRLDLKELFSPINSSLDELVVNAERSFLRALDGGCQVPIGVFSKLDGRKIFLKGFLSDLESDSFYEAESEGEINHAEELAKNLALRLLSQRSGF